jgi:TRAP-type C4-dicarboxylate transport system substrate-binding protein
VTTDPGEVYTALERGVVDGFLYPQGPAVIESKWYEVVKYVVSPTVPYDNCCFLLANAQRWDGLPEKVKKEVMDLLLKMEPQVYQWQTAESAKSIDWAIKQGYLKVTELPPPESEKYKKAAKDALWSLITKLDPENGPKFKEMDEKIRASRK